MDNQSQQAMPQFPRAIDLALSAPRSDQPATRYHYRREGLRWVIRAGTGTRPLFRVWRERAAMVLCSELLCAFLDGDFARREKQRSDSAGESNG